MHTPTLLGSAGFPGEYAAAAVQERELPLAPVGLAVARLLIDANLSPKVARALGKSGLEAVHVGDVGLLTASDRSLLDYAAANDLVSSSGIYLPQRSSWPAGRRMSSNCSFPLAVVTQSASAARQRRASRT